MITGELCHANNQVPNEILHKSHTKWHHDGSIHSQINICINSLGRIYKNRYIKTLKVVLLTINIYTSVQRQNAVSAHFSNEQLLLFAFPLHYSRPQQTRDADTTLVQCWSIVCDAGPTLNQHWVNVPCLLAYYAR